MDTTNYNIKYNIKKYDYQNIVNNNIIIEIYRNYLYNKLKKKLKKLRQKEDNNILSLPLLYDIFSIFIINHNFNSSFDPIFDNISPFEIQNIKNYFYENCLPTLSDDIIKVILKILHNISKKYLKYYKKINKYINLIDTINYIIYYEIDKIVCIYFEILNIPYFFKKVKYKNKIFIPIHIFNHLVKLFNIKILNNYTSNEVLDKIVIEYIYMVFIRYKIFSSGNNQASLLPSFKKILKEKLNIKIELFGSAINTSSSNFGSIFYDIENVFGSIGNYFNTIINKGYFEINPVFDKCIIDKIIDKCYKELISAEKNNNPLLFFFILPNSYFRYSNKINLLKLFIKFDIIIPKEKFPYIRYNRKFTQTTISPIVNTRIIICHNSHINFYIKNNVTYFNKILEQWQNKKK